MLRVLLVDDEEDALDLLEILLGQIGGIEVVGKYMNPVQAIEVLSRLPVDAVFLDNQMPGLMGTEAARAIREKLPSIPIVFTTAYAEYAVEAFEIQSTDYLLKPFTRDRLASAVARIRQSLSASYLETRRSESPVASVHCLGGFHIRLSASDSRMLPWRTKKGKELCAYLIHQDGKAASTASIIEALWPGYDLDKAKTYLYTCMSYLRKSLSEYRVPIHIQKADQGFVAILDEVVIDRREFELLLRRVLSDEELDQRLYDNINLLYRGEYMEACDYDWAAPAQLEIKSAYIRALRKWYKHFRSKGIDELAIDSMQRVLALAPDSEADGRELITLYLEAGNRNEALRIFQQLEQNVRVQLGVELEEGTVRLLRTPSDPFKLQERGAR